jgi:hypothetical protein
MSLSRRKFLRSGAVCALTVGALSRSPLVAFGQEGARAVPRLDFQIPYEATINPVFYFSRATFEPYVGSTFATTGIGGRSVELQLVSVTGYEPSTATRLTTRPRRQTNCFSLQFRASGQLRQLTTIHTLDHGALGKFNLFVTESQAEGAWFYEAVVNHIAS